MIEPARPARVLLVEDSPDDAELMVAALRAGGLEVDPLVVADEAGVHAVLTGFEPDVVLADLAIPGFSGGAVVEMTRAWDPDVPCIFVSGSLADDLVSEAIRTKATDYVPKQHLEALAPCVQRRSPKGPNAGRGHVWRPTLPRATRRCRRPWTPSGSRS